MKTFPSPAWGALSIGKMSAHIPAGFLWEGAGGPFFLLKERPSRIFFHNMLLRPIFMA